MLALVSYVVAVVNEAFNPEQTTSAKHRLGTRPDERPVRRPSNRRNRRKKRA